MNDKDNKIMNIHGAGGLIDQDSGRDKTKRKSKRVNPSDELYIFGAGGLLDPNSQANQDAQQAQAVAKSRALSTFAQYLSGLTDEEKQELRDKALKAKELPGAAEISLRLKELIEQKLTAIENKTKDKK